jgi:hypothetical protein
MPSLLAGNDVPVAATEQRCGAVAAERDGSDATALAAPPFPSPRWPGAQGTVLACEPRPRPGAAVRRAECDVVDVDVAEKRRRSRRRGG